MGGRYLHNEKRYALLVSGYIWHLKIEDIHARNFVVIIYKLTFQCHESRGENREIRYSQRRRHLEAGYIELVP